MRRAERFLIDSLPVAGRIVPGGMEREDTPLLPVEALREGAVVFTFGLPAETTGKTTGMTPGETPGETPGDDPGLLLAEPGLSVPELAARIGPDKGGYWHVIELAAA